ncbi:MAG: hypothetical protein H7Z15_13335 [Rhizobacter sp.]|nr:hypothetical protein [Rhizobacter sp.]
MILAKRLRQTPLLMFVEAAMMRLMGSDFLFWPPRRGRTGDRDASGAQLAFSQFAERQSVKS